MVMQPTRLPGKKMNLNIDISKLPDMECWCGHTEFIRVFKLRYVSPMLCGNPTGASVHIQQYECRNCGQRYGEALPQEKIDEIRISKLNQETGGAGADGN